MDCDRCNYRGSTVKELVAHIIEAHRVFKITFKCNFCEYESSSKDELDSHMAEWHEMVVVLNGICKNQQYVSDSLDEFKVDVTNTLKRVIEENVMMRQEIFILRQASQSVKDNTHKQTGTQPPKKQATPT